MFAWSALPANCSLTSNCMMSLLKIQWFDTNYLPHVIVKAPQLRNETPT